MAGDCEKSTTFAAVYWIRMKIRIKKIRSEWWAYVWQHRKLMGRLAVLGVLVGLVVWLSIPNEYETDIFTAAEARVVYVDQNGMMTNRDDPRADRIRDAILPSHYRALIASPTFLMPLSRILVTLDDDAHTSMTLYDYMAEHQRYPWWQYIVSGVFSIPRLMLAPFRDNDEDTLSLNQPFRETLLAADEGVVRLSRKDARVVKALRRRFDVEIDADKQSVALMVRMQDPLVSATVADSLLAHLHRYMNRYRREKEQQRLDENEELLRQTREDYHRAQDEYARYADSHRALATTTARAELAKYRVRMQLAEREYRRASRLVQASRRRVAMERPVLTVIEGARVPRHPASPSAPPTIGGWLLVAVGGGLGWLWLKKNRFVIRWKRRPCRRRYRIVWQH